MVGLAGGLASGLLGVGGGIVMVPLLTLWLRIDRRTAHAVSLAAILPIAAVGSALFIAEGQVELQMVALLAAGGVGGSILGVRLLDRISDHGLRWTFAAFAFIAGLRMVLS